MKRATRFHFYISSNCSCWHIWLWRWIGNSEETRDTYFLMQMAWVWTWGWRLIGNLVQSQNASQFGNGERYLANGMGRADWPCRRPLRVDLEVPQARANQQGPGHHRDRQDPEALSHPGRTKIFAITLFWKLKTGRTEGRWKDKKGKLQKYLQVLLSLQQGLGDPEGQVDQTGQLDRQHQQDLSHRESPVSARKRERRWVKNERQRMYSGETDTACRTISSAIKTCTKQDSADLHCKNINTHIHTYTQTPFKRKPEATHSSRWLLSSKKAALLLESCQHYLLSGSWRPGDPLSSEQLIPAAENAFLNERGCCCATILRNRNSVFT